MEAVPGTGDRAESTGHARHGGRFQRREEVPQPFRGNGLADRSAVAEVAETVRDRFDPVGLRGRWSGVARDSCPVGPSCRQTSGEKGFSGIEGRGLVVSTGPRCSVTLDARARPIGATYWTSNKPPESYRGPLGAHYLPLTRRRAIHLCDSRPLPSWINGLGVAETFHRHGAAW